MPSSKKRINLTVPDALYNRLQAYKEKTGISNDASACLQLITQQLNGLEQMESMQKLFNNLSMDQLKAISGQGLDFVQDAFKQTGK